MQVISDQSFESLRAQLSHALLQNGMLILLSTPPDLWNDRNIPSEDRVAKLVKSWPAVEAKPYILRTAAETWRGQNMLGVSVTDAVRRLYAAAHKGRRVRPGPRFPAQGEIEAWLSDMKAVLVHFDRPAGEIASLEHSLVANFWRSSIALADFVSALQIGSERFWHYFEKIPK